MNEGSNANLKEVLSMGMSEYSRKESRKKNRNKIKIWWYIYGFSRFLVYDLLGLYDH